MIVEFGATCADYRQRFEKGKNKTLSPESKTGKAFAYLTKLQAEINGRNLDKEFPGSWFNPHPTLKGFRDNEEYLASYNLSLSPSLESVPTLSSSTAAASDPENHDLERAD